MLGFDTVWSSDGPTSDDPELARMARAEGRVLLTRDRALYESLQAEGLSDYVQATDPAEQLREVLARRGLLEEGRAAKRFLTLCLECNSHILPCQGHQLVERLPADVRAR